MASGLEFVHKRCLMKGTIISRIMLLSVLVAITSPTFSVAWHDETHLAVPKSAGYSKWYHATGADMAKIKAGDVEAHNHYVRNPPGTVVTSEMVLGQIKKYNQIDEQGHLYGAIVASIRDYIKKKKKGKYGEYHMGFCAHYVGDLSQPLHNTLNNGFNSKYHYRIDGTINGEVLKNLKKLKNYAISIESEKDLAKEIARIANIAIGLGYRIESENRPLTKEEAYMQVSHSSSLFKAILEYAKKAHGADN